MELTRRSLLKGGALAAGAAAAGAAPLVAHADDVPGHMPEKWDYEADLVIVGSGDAGLCAAIAADQEGVGSVILLECAPEAEMGGNSRCSGHIMFIPNDVDGAIKYQKALNAGYEVDEDRLRAWAEGVYENYDWLTDLGADLQPSTSCNPEFGDVEGNEACDTYRIDGVAGAQVGWQFIKDCFDETDADIQFETRATKLVYDPATREVFGLIAEKGGQEVSYKARKAVILACGGFENNDDILKSYYTIGYSDPGISGTPWNRGDGILMCEDIGAELFNMNNFAHLNLATVTTNYQSERPLVRFPVFSTKDWIYVGPNSKRFIYEEAAGLSKHGKIKRDGIYVHMHLPRPAWTIIGSNGFNAGPLVSQVSCPVTWTSIVGQVGYENQDLVDAGLWFQSDDIRELAEKIGLDPDVLEETVNTYNGYCDTGVDLDFGRGQDYYGNFSGMSDTSRKAIEGGETAANGDSSTSEDKLVIEHFALERLEPPYTAMPLYQALLNSQGGPKRSAEGQVLRVGGEPIPRLYAAGELGTVYRYQYNGGMNVSDAIASGRLAARNAAKLEAWDA